MNVRPENYVFVIVSKMTWWLERAFFGLDHHGRVRARRNYLRLIRKHGDIAAQYRFDVEDLSWWKVRLIFAKNRDSGSWRLR